MQITLTHKFKDNKMTYEEYTQAVARINEELQTIAKITKNQAWVGTADFSNPLFINLMKKHISLTTLSSNLTEKMLEQLTNNG